MSDLKECLPEEIFLDVSAYKEGRLEAWHTCHSGYIRYTRTPPAATSKEVVEAIEWAIAFMNRTLAGYPYRHLKTLIKAAQGGNG